MHLDAHEVEQRMASFADALRGSGVKVTHQRLEIYREVLQGSDHPDAEASYQGVRARVPTVSLDTVYRTLWLLSGLGLIGTLGEPRERVRFDANTLPHHHFICEACGAAMDFTSSEFDALAVPAAAAKLGQVQRTYVELRGLCNQCAAHGVTLAGRGPAAQHHGNKSGGR
jgi:Fur family peroxide stress response transcriptional regulator